jgi:hypothetical protein
MLTLARRALPQAVAALRALGDRPGTLLLTLFALNAVTLPYGGIINDAQLYAAQALHRLDDTVLGDDLFFRYGSQDQFSLFSAVVAPLVSAFGLPVAFFLAYVSSEALLLWGMQRLVRALIPDRALSTLALLALAVSPLPYGGFGVLRVHEACLTPRPLALALALLGLERMLCYRFGAALALAVAGCLMHPIMAAPALAVVALWWAWHRLSPRRCVLLASTAALALVTLVFWPPLGACVFERMDDSWLAMVRQASPYASPLDWPEPGPGRALSACALLLAGAWAARRRQPRLAGLALLAVLVAGGGVAASVVGSVTGYALLVQAQLYRALWLVAVLQVPVGLWLATCLWAQGTPGRLLALAVLAYLGLDGVEVEYYFFALALAPALLVCRGLERTPRSPGWLWQSVAVSLALAIVGRAALTVAAVLARAEMLIASLDGVGLYRVLLLCPGGALWTAVAVAALAVAWGRLGLGPALRGLALCTALAAELVVFVVPATRHYRERYESGHADLQLVARFLAAARPSGAPAPTVYWCNAKMSTLWLDLGVRSYYQLYQAQGQLYSRETAREARRRALLVGRFEMDYLGRETTFMHDDWRKRLASYYQAPLEGATPTRADLERLCREDVDYIILDRNLDGRYAATNGHCYIYDCRRLRKAQLATSGPTAEVGKRSAGGVVAAGAVDARAGVGGGRRKVQAAHGSAMTEPRECRPEE